MYWDDLANMTLSPQIVSAEQLTEEQVAEFKEALFLYGVRQGRRWHYHHQGAGHRRALARPEPDGGFPVQKQLGSMAA